MTPLYAELHRWASLPFLWGESDCCLVVCDWVERVTGIDPARDLRMTYDSAGSCQRETGFLRDPLRITTQCMEGIAGLARTAAPVAGDVGVIKILLEGQVRPVAALCLGPAGWAVKSIQRGTTTLAPSHVIGVMRAWSVGYSAGSHA
ncbi:hypothetical protein P775_14280 [Puniceibacterium antarcticum]|uniref:DUF6950 domain-containing protein n=1 Tax=Puniceibacterium antarcticum TaxID=1206336 RepID=A0A2G8RD94_9RHOB|nr:hypothetical protein [Puniceibacterium antarcticum]PIL19517.1 hypothetical protein P775_14280 [Puniceibacterium antarcticum]